MFAPSPFPNQMLKLNAIGIRWQLAEEDQFERAGIGQRVQGADKGVLIFPEAYGPHAQDDGRFGVIRLRLGVKKIPIYSIRQNPGSRHQVRYRRLSVAGDANHPAGSRQRKPFQACRQPIEGKRLFMIHLGNESHIAVQRQEVGKAGKDCANTAIPLSPLPVHDVRLDRAQFFAHRANTARVSGAQPAQLGHQQAMVKNIRGDFFGRFYRALHTGDNMHLRFRQFGKPLQQGSRSRPKARRGR